MTHLKSLLYTPDSSQKSSFLNFLMNVISIRDMNIKIKEYKISDGTELQKTLSNVAQFYLNDLIYNQKLKILAGVYPIRVVVNVVKAFASLVKHPVDSYVNDKYVLIGVLQGFGEFFARLSHEFGDIGAKVVESIKFNK